MKCMAHNYFANLFTTNPEVCPNLILEHVEPKITELVNEGLCKEFSEQEISDTMFHMGPLKAPAPDVFSAHFYQRHWDILGKDIVDVTQRFFSDSVLSEGVNDTAIVLIPKGDSPEELKEFRPISLCNVI
jgi:hypothetical protein